MERMRENISSVFQILNVFFCCCLTSRARESDSRNPAKKSNQIKYIIHAQPVTILYMQMTLTNI